MPIKLNKERKFIIGDKVRAIGIADNLGVVMIEGKSGVVTEVDEDYYASEVPVKVLPDGWSKKFGNGVWCFPERLILIEEGGN